MLFTSYLSSLLLSLATNYPLATYLSLQGMPNIRCASVEIIFRYCTQWSCAETFKGAQSDDETYFMHTHTHTVCTHTHTPYTHRKNVLTHCRISYSLNLLCTAFTYYCRSLNAVHKFLHVLMCKRDKTHTHTHTQRQRNAWENAMKCKCIKSNARGFECL